MGEMGEMGGTVPRNEKGAPRAALSHLTGDLDRRARLAVEGLQYTPSGCCRHGNTSDVRGLHTMEALFDPETVLCNRWVASMEVPHGS